MGSPSGAGSAPSRATGFPTIRAISVRHRSSRCVTEVLGLSTLLLGLVGLCAIGAFVACSLRLTSAAEFLLATYVLSWAWLVGVILFLSPPRLVTRGWLLGAVALGVLVSAGAWLRLGKPA